MKFGRKEYQLYTGARKDSNIFVWDIRKSAQHLMGCYLRNADTNQRMIFDVDEYDTLMAVGSCDGKIDFYDILKNQHVGTIPAHYDSTSCIQFSPISPEIILSCSGQRHYEASEMKDPNTQDIELSDEDMKTDQNVLKYRNGIRMWKINYDY